MRCRQHLSIISGNDFFDWIHVIETLCVYSKLLVVQEISPKVEMTREGLYEFPDVLIGKGLGFFLLIASLLNVQPIKSAPSFRRKKKSLKFCSVTYTCVLYPAMTFRMKQW